MPAMQCSAKQWLLSCHDSFTVKSVGGSFFVFVNECLCEIWTVASIPIICITFSENLTQFLMIVNPTIESLLFSECRSHKNTYKKPYDKYRCRWEKYIWNRRVLNWIMVRTDILCRFSLISIFLGFRAPSTLRNCVSWVDVDPSKANKVNLIFYTHYSQGSLVPIELTTKLIICCKT